MYGKQHLQLFPVVFNRELLGIVLLLNFFYSYV